jgi:uncharacterized membrane protein YhaH (DUF805 family)/RNA polymerase subunit RPABC4/transcription elongation factor Spt4
MNKICKACGMIWQDEDTVCKNCGGELQPFQNFGETMVLNQASYDERTGVQNLNGYNQQNNYGQQSTYSQQSSYEQQNTYTQQNGYVQQNNYGQQNTYTQQNEYNQANTSGQQNYYPQQPATPQQGYAAGQVKNNNIWESYVLFWKNFATFSGRTRRRDYWQVALMNILIGIIFAILGKIPLIGAIAGIASVILSVASIIPGLAICIRRLHDIGKSGWFYLMILIPLAGPIIMLVFLCTDSKPGANEYGENPKGIM